MTNYNSMTDKEKTIALLTRVCGWELRKCCGVGGCLISPTGFHYANMANLPPITISADAAIEHVGKAIKASGRDWRYSAHFKKAYIFCPRYDMAGDFIHWLSEAKWVGNGDLAYALCEAAYKMMKGNEG